MAGKWLRSMEKLKQRGMAFDLLMAFHDRAEAEGGDVEKPLLIAARIFDPSTDPRETLERIAARA